MQVTATMRYTSRLGAGIATAALMTTLADGTALTNLGGYKVRYGQTPGTLTEVRDIANSATTSVTIEGLSSDMSYFTLASYTNAGVESAPTGAFSKTII
jgi:hypothetical protein